MARLALANGLTVHAQPLPDETATELARRISGAPTALLTLKADGALLAPWEAVPRSAKRLEVVDASSFDDAFINGDKPSRYNFQPYPPPLTSG